VLTNAERAARWRAAHPEEAKAAYRKHRESHAEERKAGMRLWRENNREHVAAYIAEYEQKPERKAAKRRRYAEDPGKGRARTRSWREAHPLDVKRHRHEKRARRKQAEGSYTVEEVLTLLDAQEHRCANPHCGQLIDKSNWALDHKIALVNGGANSIENLQWLCIPCNSRKGVLDLDEWLKRESDAS
jgi:5-methylcytosine-specific restriction endonuclease McrA